MVEHGLYLTVNVNGSSKLTYGGGSSRKEDGHCSLSGRSASFLLTEHCGGPFVCCSSWHCAWPNTARCYNSIEALFYILHQLELVQQNRWSTIIVSYIQRQIANNCEICGTSRTVSAFFWPQTLSLPCEENSSVSYGRNDYARDKGYQYWNARKSMETYDCQNQPCRNGKWRI